MVVYCFVTTVLWSTLHLPYSSEAVKRLNYQILQKSHLPLPFTVWIHPWIKWSIEHTRKRLFFYNFKSFNMAWSATLLHMVNYNIVTNHTSTPLPLTNSLRSEMRNLRQLGKWLRCFMTFNMATCTTHCKPETKKAGYSSYACLLAQVTKTFNRWQQWLRRGLPQMRLYSLV